MTESLFYLLHLFSCYINKGLAVKLRFALAQVEFLEKRLEANRIILSPDERRQLLAIGAEIGHNVKDSLSIVTWPTYLRWRREERAGKEPKTVGANRTITEADRATVVRLAQDNPGGGAKRIFGELKKLMIDISRSSVQRILKQEGCEPTPEKTKRSSPPIPWNTFIAAHLDSIVATDFFCQTIYTLRGKFDAYCLFFIHLGTRRVYCSVPTRYPTERGVMQQVRNVAMWIEDEGINFRFLIHDRERRVAADILRGEHHGFAFDCCRAKRQPGLRARISSSVSSEILSKNKMAMSSRLPSKL